eukprot:4789917-Prymnesium_polylepis.1
MAKTRPAVDARQLAHVRTRCGGRGQTGRPSGARRRCPRAKAPVNSRQRPGANPGFQGSEEPLSGQKSHTASLVALRCKEPDPVLVLPKWSERHGVKLPISDHEIENCE